MYELIGLSYFHFKVLLFTLIAALVVFIVMACHKFGVLSEVQFHVQKFPRSRIIYINHKGPYKDIHHIFQRIKQDISKHFFISNYFGIYYDNPKQISDENLCRSTIGLIVNDGEIGKKDSFLQKYDYYKSHVLPATKCISTRHPYVNFLSFLLIIGKVYPKLEQYAARKQLQTGHCSIQVYHFVSATSKQVQILCPLENFNDFMLWEDLNQPIPMKKRL